jgi:hypothetical protein
MSQMQSTHSTSKQTAAATAKSQDAAVDSGATLPLGAESSSAVQLAAAKALESWADMNGEMAVFVANRLREDLAAQHKLLCCRSLGEISHLQAQFMQRAIDQYLVGTGKIVAMQSALLGGLGKPSED